jgi:hypothetical protein
VVKCEIYYVLRIARLIAIRNRVGEDQMLCAVILHNNEAYSCPTHYVQYILQPCPLLAALSGVSHDES